MAWTQRIALKIRMREACYYNPQDQNLRPKIMKSSTIIRFILKGKNRKTKR